MNDAGDGPMIKSKSSARPIVASGIFLLIALMPMFWLGSRIVRRVHAELKQMADVADELHASMTNGDDASIFRIADASYQQGFGVMQSNQLFDEVRSQLGAPLETKFLRAEDLPTMDGGKKYLLRFQTRFAKAYAREIIAIHFDPDSQRFRMLSYSVESESLSGAKLSLSTALPR